MSEEAGRQQPTVGLPQWPTREDFMAALQIATWACECPPLVSRVFALLFPAYAASRCCKSCQARRALSELVAWSERP